MHVMGHSNLTLFCLSLLFSVACAAGDSSSEQKHSILQYTPSNALTSIAVVLILIVALIHSWFLKKWGGRFMLTLVIGEYCFALGFIIRFLLHSHPDSLGIYIIEDMFILLSPCAFLAGNYVLLSHLARHLDSGDLLIVRPSRLATIFVTSDITTFFIQAGGGGLSASQNINTANMGMHIALAGLALQLVSYSFFTLVFLVFLFRIRTQCHEVWTRDSHGPRMHDWRILAFALFISCLGILVRSAYRVDEMSEGYTGHLSTTEYLFYCLDTLPLFIAISVYVPFWPGKYITPEHSLSSLPLHDVSSTKLARGSNGTTRRSY